MSLSHNQFPNHFSATTASADVQEQFEPTYVKLDKQVLRFQRYFKEHVVESRLENHRIRKVTIFYYLEDKSVMITEPKQVNAGIPQGAFLNRHCVLKNDGTPYMPDDFCIGCDTGIYGRQIRIYDADDYTRRFYQQQGRELPPAQQGPSDNFEHSQKRPPVKKDPELLQFLEKKLGGGKVASQKQFLDHDRQVLRFFTRCQGLPYVVHYYLADDTVEIRECHTPNDGRDAFAVLLRRQKLPDRSDVNQPGQNFIGDNYLTCDEIQPGQDLYVYGSTYEIRGVDPFTQQFYRQRYGYEFPLGRVEFDQPPEQAEREVPPYNGFGDEEDTKGQMYRLVPQKPKVDFFKAMDNSHNVLRFTAKFNTRVPEDVDRRFIISFYLADDTLGIYEPAQKNSGIIEGKFLHRNKYKNVDKNLAFIVPTDLGIGGNVKINGHSFHILSADEYTVNYMNQYVNDE